MNCRQLLLPVRSILLQAWDWIFPPVCAVCGGFTIGGPSAFLCSSCAISLFPISSPYCPQCGFPYQDQEAADHLCAVCRDSGRGFLRARAAFVYDGATRNLVIRFKFGRLFALAPELVLLAAETLAREFNPGELDVIVPVPLHPRRLREREYNQSLLLARAMAEPWEIPVDFVNLQRSRWTEPQTQLPKSQRRQNVKGAFSIREEADFADKRILLVDDVFTTGATVEECASVLLKAGAKQIEVFTFARAV